MGKNNEGFTIVELLIVVVVIAILAAITIVSFNGITNQAKRSAAQSAAKQVNTKVQAYFIDNADQYPDGLSSIGIIDSSDTKYEYRSNNLVTPKTFCLTTTTQNVSYYVSNTQATPTLGACSGHGSNGVAAITNYALNPSYEANNIIYGRSGSSPAAANHYRDTTRSHNGPTSLLQDILSSGQTGLAMPTPGSGERLRVNAGESAYWSFWVYSTKAGSLSPYCDGALTTSGYAGLSSSSNVTVPANTWTKVVGVGTRPVGSGDMYITQCGAYNINVVAGDKLWYDEFIITTGATLRQYYDGNSNGWLWNGTVNNATSTGVPF